jgi:Ca2+-binding RTX toxin-like protein
MCVSHSAEYRYTLLGSNANDTLTGLEGNDCLVGSLGKDRLIGGNGGDQFIFNKPNEGGDTIADFNANQGDRLVLSALGFGGGLVAGSPLSLNQLVFGITPTQTCGQLLYDSTKSQLWFDVDGSGSGKAILIAGLTNKPILNTSTFIVV